MPSNKSISLLKSISSASPAFTNIIIDCSNKLQTFQKQPFAMCNKSLEDLFFHLFFLLRLKVKAENISRNLIVIGNNLKYFAR